MYIGEAVSDVGVAVLDVGVAVLDVGVVCIVYNSLLVIVSDLAGEGRWGISLGKTVWQLLHWCISVSVCGGWVWVGGWGCGCGVHSMHMRMCFVCAGACKLMIKYE